MKPRSSSGQPSVDGGIRSSVQGLSGQGGYSLIEFVISTGIIALISGMAVIGTDSMVNRHESKIVHEEVFHALTLARNYARAKDMCVRLRIEAKTIEILGYREADCSVDPTTSPVLTDIRNLEGDYSLSAFDVENPLRFNRDGSLTAGRKAVMTVSGQNQSWQLAVYPLLGQVKRE